MNCLLAYVVAGSEGEAEARALREPTSIFVCCDLDEALELVDTSPDPRLRVFEVLVQARVTVAQERGGVSCQS